METNLALVDAFQGFMATARPCVNHGYSLLGSTQAIRLVMCAWRRMLSLMCGLVRG